MKRDIIKEERTKKLIAELNNIASYREKTYCDEGIAEEAPGLTYKFIEKKEYVVDLKKRIKSLLGVDVKKRTENDDDEIQKISLIEKDLPGLAKKGLKFDGIYYEDSRPLSAPTPSSAQFCMAFTLEQMRQWVAQMQGDEMHTNILLDAAETGDDKMVLELFKDDLDDFKRREQRGENLTREDLELQAVIKKMQAEALAIMKKFEATSPAL